MLKMYNLTRYIAVECIMGPVNMTELASPRVIGVHVGGGKCGLFRTPKTFCGHRYMCQYIITVHQSKIKKFLIHKKMHWGAWKFEVNKK